MEALLGCQRLPCPGVALQGDAGRRGGLCGQDRAQQLCRCELPGSMPASPPHLHVHSQPHPMVPTPMWHVCPSCPQHFLRSQPNPAMSNTLCPQPSALTPAHPATPHPPVISTLGPMLFFMLPLFKDTLSSWRSHTVPVISYYPLSG